MRDRRRNREGWLPPASLVQAVYYLATGLWPLVHYRSFERITGPKVDDWLARTAGALIGSVGLVLLTGGVRGRATEPETAMAGLSAGASLATADLIYALRGRISKVYLLDALAHVPLLALWLRDLRRARRVREAEAPQIPDGVR